MEIVWGTNGITLGEKIDSLFKLGYYNFTVRNRYVTCMEDLYAIKLPLQHREYFDHDNFKCEVIWTIEWDSDKRR